MGRANRPATSGSSPLYFGYWYGQRVGGINVGTTVPTCAIRAIDIEPSAVEQAAFNFSHSPWTERIKSEQATLQTYNSTESFDLVVSNPPYFENSLKNPDKGRELARHTDSLPYADLVTHTARLLSPEGMAVYILPAEAETSILSLTAAAGLSPCD